MGLEGVHPSNHTLPTPMGQLQSTTARERDPDGRKQHWQQQQQQSVGEKNSPNATPNANANAISACSSNSSPNINPLSGSNSTNTFNTPRPTSSPAIPPLQAASAETPMPVPSPPQVNSSGNVNPGNANGPRRIVERIPWAPARPISAGPPLNQANGGGRATNFGNGNGNGPPRRMVEFIPFEPHKPVHRGANNANPTPSPRVPQPQINFASSNTTAGIVAQPPTMSTPPAVSITQSIPPTVNGSTSQGNMGRPQAMTAAPSIAKNPTRPLNSTTPTAAPINAPPASIDPTATLISKVTKTTATTTPKLKRKATSTPRGGGAKRGRKRKSAKFDDDEDVIRVGDTSTSSDESDDPTPATTMTKSGRQVHRPTAFVPPPEPQQETDVSTSANRETQQPQRKKRRTYRKGRENNVTCVRCWRGHSPASNVIVFCDECNGAWHQFCHDPPIGNEVIAVKEAQWFCRECRPVENGSVAKRLQDRPVPNEVFPVASQVLVGGGLFTPEQKRGYLAGLSHAALVKLLFDVSNSQPGLAIFPENLLELPSATVLPPPAPPKASKASLDLSTTTPNTSISTTTPALAPTQPTTTAPPPPAARSIPQPTSTTIPFHTNDKYHEDEIEDPYTYSDHRLYPRAGNGFHLPPDTADLDMLLEDPSCTTFSHALHGRARARMQIQMRTEMEMQAGARAGTGVVQVVGGVA